MHTSAIPQLLLMGLAAAGLVGCVGAPDGPLIELADWRLLDASHDPFPEPPGPSPDCAFNGVRLEAGALEIDTGRCPYALVGWPLLRPVPAGTPLRALLSHGPLASLEGGSGHAALVLAGQVLLEARVPIPSSAAIYDERTTLSADAPEQTLVILHLHNHGANSWRLHQLDEETP